MSFWEIILVYASEVIQIIRAMAFEHKWEAAALILAIISLILVFYVEWMRRPSLEFLFHKDEYGPEDQKRGYMWYHLKIRNIEPKFFNRDAAISCIIRIDFLDMNTKKPLVPQITSHWTSQPEPRDYSSGDFVPSLIPICQRIDIVFRPEMADILIKYQGEDIFYAADPWVVYQPNYEKGSLEWERLKINASECIIKAEVESINLGNKRKVDYFILRNKGARMEDIEILPSPGKKWLSFFRKINN